MTEININGTLCHSLEQLKEACSDELYAFFEEYLSDTTEITAHTSGSTGKPKEIHLSKSDMVQSARATNEFFSIDKDSILYLCLSPKYIAGKMVVVRAIEAGCKLIEETPSNTPLADYYTDPVCLISLVPSQMTGLFNTPDRLQYIKRILLGGGAVSDKLRRKIVDYGLDAYESYGMTETCSHVALAHIEIDRQPFTMVGRNTASVDDRGCLVIDLPDYTVKRITTNDIVELLDEKHFYWLGRIDNVVNTGGIKVFPEQVEPVIARVLPKAKFFLTGIPDEKWGQRLVMVLEYPSLKEGTYKIGEVKPQLIEELKHSLPTANIPRTYIAIPKMEYTATCKIIRKIPTFVDTLNLP